VQLSICNRPRMKGLLWSEIAATSAMVGRLHDERLLSTVLTRASLFSVCCATGRDTSADGEFAVLTAFARPSRMASCGWSVREKIGHGMSILYSGQQSTAAHSHLASSREIESRTFRPSSVLSRSRVSRFGHLQPVRVRRHPSRQEAGHGTVFMFLRHTFASGPMAYDGAHVSTLQIQQIEK